MVKGERDLSVTDARGTEDKGEKQCDLAEKADRQWGRGRSTW